MKRFAVICYAILLAGLFTIPSTYAIGKTRIDEYWAAVERNRQAIKFEHRAPEFLRRINTSLSQGHDYLRSMQAADGSWKGTWSEQAIHRYVCGETAFCALALMESGTNPSEELIQRAFQYLRKQVLQKTYEVALIMMAIEARWTSYQGRVKVFKDREWMQECARFLLEHIEKSGYQRQSDSDAEKSAADTWHYPGPQGSSTDHSNTHFALLGLGSARRCGVPIPASVWAGATKHYVETQEGSGTKVRRVSYEGRDEYDITRLVRTDQEDCARGWCYRADRRGQSRSMDKLVASTGSMTAAGVCSLLVALRSMDCTRQVPLEPGTIRNAGKAVRDGLAWLDRYWSIRTNPGHPWKQWHYYYMFALEQACVLANKRFIGKKDWFRLGAEYLLKAQKEDGSWDCAHAPGPICNTCFALLFLAPPCYNPEQGR